MTFIQPYDSPLGDILLAADETGLTGLWFEGEKYFADKKDDNLKILDMGTGSGAIAVALAKNFKNAKVFACDISENALSLAAENAKLNKVNVEFIKSTGSKI